MAQASDIALQAGLYWWNQNIQRAVCCYKICNLDVRYSIVALTVAVNLNFYICICLERFVFEIWQERVIIFPVKFSDIDSKRHWIILAYCFKWFKELAIEFNAKWNIKGALDIITPIFLYLIS